MTNRPYRQLRKDLRGQIPAAVWPAGTGPARFDPDRHAAEAHELLVEAYRLGGGEVDALEAWWPNLRDDPEYDAGAVFIVLDGTERVIGLAHCWTSAFLKDLAVSERWRRRGVGEALLLHVFGRFKRMGALHFDLKVEIDNPWGAERLYRRLGMRPLY